MKPESRESVLVNHSMVVMGLAVIATLQIILVSCGKPTPPDPGPVPPNPLTDFSIVGKTVQIDGKLKPGTSLTLAEVKRSMKTAVDQIDAGPK